MKKLIVDITVFASSRQFCGITRFVDEILKRIVRRHEFEIVLICPMKDEGDALRNFKLMTGLDLPFQSRNPERFIHSELPEPEPPKPKLSFLRRLENQVDTLCPGSKIIGSFIETIRKIKWLISPPPPPPPVIWREPRADSLQLQKLFAEPGIYFSPFHPFAQELSASSPLRRFVVIYDLIPLVFPKMYSEHLALMLSDLLASITPETGILTDSHHSKSDILRFAPSIRQEQITVVPLAADSRFCPCDDRNRIHPVLKKYGIPADSDYVLSVAGLDIRKNLDHLLRSFGQWVKRYGRDRPTLKLVLTGNKGWKSDTIQNTYRKLSKACRDRIIFTGYVADEDLPLLYNGAKCFCFMSLYEGFGLPPLEAMQSGTPVIVSNGSSLPEVVGDAGLLLDPHDETGLVEALQRILSDPGLHDEMARNSVKQAARFSWDRCTETIVDILDGATP